MQACMHAQHPVAFVYTVLNCSFIRLILEISQVQSRPEAHKAQQRRSLG